MDIIKCCRQFCRLGHLSYLCNMIFYFSGTGNTRWAARQIAEITGERLLSIAGEADGDCRYALAEGERIGFCFPVHGWQPPAIVRNFISKCKFDNAKGHFCFALCTCGDNIGRTMEMLAADLHKVGIQADSVFSLAMPNTYVCLPFMNTDRPDVERKKIADAGRQCHCGNSPGNKGAPQGSVFDSERPCAISAVKCHRAVFQQQDDNRQAFPGGQLSLHQVWTLRRGLPYRQHIWWRRKSACMA